MVPPRASAAPDPALHGSLELAVLALHDDRLVALLQGSDDEGWTIPRAPMQAGPLDRQADGLARASLGRAPSWLSLYGAFDSEAPQTRGLSLGLGFVALTVGDPADDVDPDWGWHPVSALPDLAAPQADVVHAGVSVLRDRIDRAPVAFRLLPPLFTLTELQRAYEVILGRRLHKASFRRALAGAGLVEGEDEWRSEGRGRPAQLYRYAPKKRRGQVPSVRFDF